MILHRRDFAQGGVEKPFMRLMAAIKAVERMAAICDHLCRLDSLAIAVMQSAVGKTDNVTGEAKSYDLTPTVVEHAGETKDTCGDLIDIVGDIAFAEKMGADGLLFAL